MVGTALLPAVFFGMKKLGRLTRRFRHMDVDRAGSTVPDFNPHREEVVGGNRDAEGMSGKISEGVGDIASGISGGEVPVDAVSVDAEQRLDRNLDQLHISEGCPHNKER